MRITELHEGWQFRLKDDGPGYYRPHHPDNFWRDAVVPGHVHVDLMRNGIIGHPFTAQNEWGCQWVDESEWVYQTSFDWLPDAGLPTRKLLFEGLDTICSIYLNEVLLAHHDNMFVPLEIDVSNALVEGTNLLRVVFESAVKVGDQRRNAYFEQEGLRHDTTFFDERAFVRKVQCMSGWDWGPRLVSCGIWQPVKLLEYASRITEFRVQQEPLADGKFRVWSTTTVEGTADWLTHFEGHPTFRGDFDVVVDQPELWWPNGYGGQPLYEAKAELSTGQTVTKRIGLRTIELRREADSYGESFSFFVNGREIWARGANWIPNDAFPSQISASDYREQVHTCKSLNMDMLRVWGGGLYESEAFYDACDSAGILVWQDFPFACSYYPDDNEFQERLSIEATHQVKRLRDRACLALWCGNNENEQMWDQRWGESDLVPPRYYGKVLFDELLASVVNELSPRTAYIPTSPTGKNPNIENGSSNDGGYGDQHYWDAWHGRGDWKYYAESTARFSSEFGFASSCSEECWAQAGLDVHFKKPDDPIVRWHDRTRKPWDIFRGFVELHYPEAETLEDWIHFSQLNQRDALRFSIEHYRISDFCKGTLIWQFNDCWPVQSWAVQDYARNLKPAGAELQRLYAPILVAIKQHDSCVDLYVANDSPDPLGDTLWIEVLALSSGSVLKRVEQPFTLADGSRALIASVDISLWKADSIVIRAGLTTKEVITRWVLCVEPKDAAWPDGHRLYTPEAPQNYWFRPK